MITTKTALYVGSCASVVFATLRTIQDGPGGETITALTLVAGCVLFVGGAVCDRLDRLIGTHRKD